MMKEDPTQRTLPGLDRTKPRPTSGQELRDLGIERAAKHAGATWRTKALEVVYVTAKKYPEITSDDVHWTADGMELPRPPDPRAWGGIMVQARKNGWITKTGRYMESRRKICHASPKPIYHSHLYPGNKRPDPDQE